MTGRPELVATAVADVFRDGLKEERHQLHDVPDRYRKDVLGRRRKWETEIEFHRRRIERLHGRLEACNQWLTEHPDGAAS